MDSALGRYAGKQGSIPAVGKAKQEAIQMGFLSAKGGRLEMEPDTINLRDLASPCRIN